MLAATLFGSQVLQLPTTKLIECILIIQLVAIAGAYIMAKMSRRFGNFRVLMFVVVIWIGICIAAYYITTEMQFYVIAVVVGLVMGGIQSLSRSTYSKVMPETRDTGFLFQLLRCNRKSCYSDRNVQFWLCAGINGKYAQFDYGFDRFLFIRFDLFIYNASKTKASIEGGSMKLYTIDTGFFKLDGGAMFGVVPKSIWNKLNPPDENNLCTWAMRCLLIEDEGRLILIDNGIGNKQSEKFFSYYYLHGDATLDKSLAAHGFNRDDITDVLLTHLHFDHCGGSVIREGDRLVPAFKNAVYWSNIEPLELGEISK